MLKKGDIFVAVIVISSCILSSLMFMKDAGDKVIISAEGREVAVCPLDKDEVITVTGRNGLECRVEIRDGRVSVVEADCPDKLCVHQKSVSKKGETIVCLPAEIVISIDSEDEGGFDAVTR
ncbi:MAG: NusG domain II-containing protein [Lachnospiraceae bacterium]|nr:NusG domain II-containing protein [Lachnospiraceae bacterium]